MAYTGEPLAVGSKVWFSEVMWKVYGPLHGLPVAFDGVDWMTDDLKDAPPRVPKLKSQRWVKYVMAKCIKPWASDYAFISTIISRNA
jgi:hypothetical protein